MVTVRKWGELGADSVPAKTATYITRELVSKPPNARLFIYLSFLKDSSNNIFYKALQWSLIQIILKQYMYLYIVISKKNSVVDKNIRKEKKTLTLMCYKKVKFKTGQKFKKIEIIF